MAKHGNTTFNAITELSVELQSLYAVSTTAVVAGVAVVSGSHCGHGALALVLALVLVLLLILVLALGL